jgi:hypothetical protein
MSQPEPPDKPETHPDATAPRACSKADLLAYLKSEYDTDNLRFVRDEQRRARVRSKPSA